MEYYIELKVDRNEDVLNKILNDESIDYKQHDRDMQSQIDIMLGLLKIKLGEEYVKYDQDKDEFRVWQLNTILAICENK